MPTATATTRSACDQLDELEERIRSGDLSVSAAALAKARDAAALAELHDEAGRRSAEQAAVAELDAARSRFRADTLPAVEQELAQLRDTYEAVVAAGLELHDRLPGVMARIRQTKMLAEQLGIGDECTVGDTTTFKRAWLDASNESAGRLKTRSKHGSAPAVLPHVLHSPAYVDRVNGRLAHQWEGSPRQQDAQREAEEWSERQRREAELDALRVEVAAEFGLLKSDFTARTRDDLVAEAQRLTTPRAERMKRGY